MSRKVEAPRGKEAIIARPLLTEGAAANLLSVSRRTLEAWRRQRRGPPWVRLGRRVRYRLEDLQRYLDGATVRPEVEQ